MRNVADTEAYNVYDVVFSKTVRALSHVVGVRRLTQPFWDRWRASDIGDETIFRFLDGVRTIDNWPEVGARIVAEETAAFARRRATLTAAEVVAGLRRLSYLCHMAHWGMLPINDLKVGTYRSCRDYYVEAETLAFASDYRRIDVPWGERTVHGNLHTPPGAEPAPIVLIVHGIDGCKEEHLATELALVEAGLAVLTLDGPGQAEALLLDGIRWSADFPTIVGRALDALRTHPRIDAANAGLLGISIGGMWAIRAAAGDARSRAIYDLGGPLHTRNFPNLPFLIKTKLCQVTGARDAAAIAQVLGQNNIESDALLRGVTAAVRIVHGGRDRVVSVADKERLRDKLIGFGQAPEVSMHVIADGDHCCTGHAHWLRADMRDFFGRVLLRRGDRAAHPSAPQPALERGARPA